MRSEANWHAIVEELEFDIVELKEENKGLTEKNLALMAALDDLAKENSALRALNAELMTMVEEQGEG